MKGRSVVRRVKEIEKMGEQCSSAYPDVYQRMKIGEYEGLNPCNNNKNYVKIIVTAHPNNFNIQFSS